MAKTKEAYLKDIETAIEQVVGTQVVNLDSFLRRDLGVQSLDLIEVFFELKRLTGRDTLAAMLFANTRNMSAFGDIQVHQLLEILMSYDAPLDRSL